ncbi:MAG: DUF362 domain-containing protein [DPANN group archaeon]|nr:DUF362 domain-containing protein [DPANN group archaeon]
MAQVYVSKCTNYQSADVDVAVSYCMNAFVKGIKRGSSVLLKPNILIGRSVSEAVTTNPELVRAVARLLKTKDCKIDLGDSPAFGNVKKALKTCGILDVCEEEGISVVEFDEASEIETVMGHISVYKGLSDYDYIINMPKAKTHALTGFTGAEKNLFGVVCGTKKSKYHLKYSGKYAFSRMIVALAGAVKPSFNIMDCVVGMEGNGPSAGSPRDIGFIAASESAPLLDLFVSDCLGFKYDEVITLDIEHKENDFDVNIHNWTILSNVEPSKLKVKDFKKTGKTKFGWITSVLTKYVSSRPVITAKCIDCKRCVENCPIEAICDGSVRPVIDYKKCIRCYCCSEICPSKAIDVKKTLFGKLFGF